MENQIESRKERVLGRQVARELTEEEQISVYGGMAQSTAISSADGDFTGTGSPESDCD